MPNPKLVIAIAAAVFLLSASYAAAAPTSVYQPTVLPKTTNTFDLGSSTAIWRNLYTNQVCLAGDCKIAWPTAGGTGNVATSTTETPGSLSYWTSNAGTPATLGKVATSSATLDLGLSGALTVIGSGQSLSIATSSLYAGTTGQFPYFSGTNTLMATSSLYLATSGNIGLGTTTPLWDLTSSNPVGGVSERLVGVENGNVSTSASVIRAVGLGVGNGTSEALGYGMLWGQKGNGSYNIFLDLTAFGVNFRVPLFLNNNQAVQSATTLGQTVNIAMLTSSNHVQYGSPYPASIPVDFKVGQNTANFTWAVYSPAANLMTLTGAGSLGIGTTTPYSQLQVTSGASATTTATFGEVGATTSKACFNTKNTAGSDISFYFVGTSMVVENNLCK